MNLKPPDHTHWLKQENLTLRVIEGYFRWYYENHKLQYESAFLTMTRYWRMWVREETDSPLQLDLSRKVTHVCLKYCQYSA
jgi:hypothetical protein